MMRKKLSFLVLMLAVVSAGRAVAQSYEERVRQYVEKHKEMAMAEQRRTGVPAAIKLGQGVLETQAGESRLCLGANNHFGIKCKRGWGGETFTHTDDAPDECFRKYTCAGDSYTDHSDFLRNSQRYAPLFRLQPTDYKGWAYGLKRCGYATNPRYAQQLIKIIEEFRLHEYTRLAMTSAPEQKAYASLEVVPEYDRPAPAVQADSPDHVQPAAVTAPTPMSAPAAAANTPATTVDTPATKAAPKAGSSKATHAEGVQIINGLKAFYARKGDVLLEHAIKYNIRYARLLEYNDLPDAPLEADMVIYLEKKNSKGRNSRHALQPGETLLQVAQAEGMQLKQLYAYNHLQPGERPEPGSILYLQQPAPRKPIVVAEDAAAPAANPAPRKQGTIGGLTSAPVATPSPRPKRAAESDYIVRKDLPVTTAMSASTTGATNVTAQRVAETTPTAPRANGPAQPNSGTAVEPTPAPATPAASTPRVPPQANETADDTETHLAAPPSAGNTINIADEPAVEEMPPASEAIMEASIATKAQVEAPTPAAAPETSPALPEEPMDEFARLKAKMDRVVYSSTTAPTRAVAPKEATTSPEVSAPAQTTATATDSPDKFHIVKKGETAFGIAKKYGITMGQLREWNNLEFQNIKVGQKLRVKP